MGRWMFSVVHPDGQPSVHDDVAMDEVFAAVGALNARWMAEDRMLFGAGLKSAQQARTVTLSTDRSTTMVTDGPFVESKEVLGGFWIIRADDAEVEGLAREAAKACQTTIEVRPLEDDPEG